MKKTVIWVLVAANVALAGTLAYRGIGQPTANAQVGAPTRGKYTLIPGTSQIGVSIIYVFDAENGRIGALAPDSKDMLTSMPTVQLKPIFDAAKAGQNPVPPKNNGNGNGNNPNRPGARPR